MSSPRRRDFGITTAGMTQAPAVYQRGAMRLLRLERKAAYFLTGSSGFLSLPSMNGLQGLALTGPGVFQTTLN